MTKPFLLEIDGKNCQAHPGQSLLEVSRDNGIEVPTLCHLDGISEVAACRLCLVEVEGSKKLLPACSTMVSEGQKIRTQTEKLARYRRMTLELFFSERNHVCSVCVANSHCELQALAKNMGLDHVRFAYLSPEFKLDASHSKFVLDHNRCVLCTRCVRVCEEVEGAHVFDVMGRGHHSLIVSDFNEPWGDSKECTSCGKCVEVCPVGALWPKEAFQGSLRKHPEMVSGLIRERKEKQGDIP